MLPDLSRQAVTPIDATVKPARVVWKKDFRPASAPAVTRDTVLAYESRSETQLELVAYDLANGAERWRTPTSTGALPGGSTLTVQTFALSEHTVVAYLERPTKTDKNYHHKLVLADAATGRRLHEIDAGFVATMRDCPVTGGLCVELVGSHNARTTKRVDPATGALTAYAPDAGDRITDLGQGLFSYRKDNKTFLGYSEGGEVQWRKPIAEFVGADLEPAKSLTHIEADPDAGLVYLTTRTKPLTNSDLRLEVKETTATVVDLAAGEKLWQAQGQSLWCPSGKGLPCSGDVTFTRKNPTSRFTVSGNKVRYRSIDYVSGESRWQKDFDKPGAPLTSTNQPVQVPPGWMVQRSGGSLLFLDQERGESTALGADNWLACGQNRNFADHEYSNPTLPVTAFRTTVFQPCSAAGASATDPERFTIAGVLGAGVKQPTDEAAEEVPAFYAVAMVDQLAIFQ